MFPVLYALVLILIFMVPAGGMPLSPVRSQADWPVLDTVEIAGELDYPVHLTSAGDGSGRLFIVEQQGLIRIYQDELLDVPFIDISDRVQAPGSGGGSEEGLLSLAFPQGYGNTINHFYVYYTNRQGDNQVSRFRVSQDANIADPGSEEVIIYFDHPINTNHNGGQLAFGPDGYLYIGTGDGGGRGDPQENAQNPASLLGKILRIDVEAGPPPSVLPTHWIYLPLVSGGSGEGSPLPYRIPPGNPFIGIEGYREEIWALGLRNPWRYSFDRSTGDLYTADVGQQAWEEVNHQPGGSPGGENYGWDIWEANACFEGPCDDPSGFVFPVFDYPNDDVNCSITGGFVYRGQNYSTISGIYLFTDYCSGIVWGLRQGEAGWESQILDETVSGISSFGEDEEGELYIIRRADETGSTGTGIIYRIIEATR